MLEWLVDNTDDWEQVNTCWKKTITIRRNLLALGITSLEYLNKFARLSIQKGKEFVSDSLSYELRSHYSCISVNSCSESRQWLVS